MPDADFRDETAPQRLVEPSTYVVAEHNRAGFETREPQIARLDLTVRRLSTWLGALTGVTILSIGLLGGVAFWLKRENDRLAQQLTSLDNYKAEVARIQTLEQSISGLDSQVKSLNQQQVLLNQQVPKGLAAQLKGIESNISSLRNTQTGLQKVESRTMTREQVDQSIERALRQQRTPGISPNPSSPFLNPPN